MSADLFPPLDVVISYRLLFGIYSGIVPDGIGDLVTSDIDWAGDASVLLSYVKHRTAAESLHLPRRAVRLLEQWLAHSALLRSLVTADDRTRLWLGTSRPGGNTLIRNVDRVQVRRWALRHDVTSDDGGPLRIQRSRIRTTHLSMRDKSAWTGGGRATIDPHHSPQVEGDHYLTAATPAQQQAVETIVADAQHDLIRRTRLPTVLTDDEAASLARDYPQLVAALRLDDAVLAELVGGERDVFTAACADQLSGLHGPKGQPCPARPWVCLLCPLAIFAPRHAAGLLRLKAFFSRQWQQMPASLFRPPAWQHANGSRASGKRNLGELARSEQLCCSMLDSDLYPSRDRAIHSAELAGVLLDQDAEEHAVKEDAAVLTALGDGVTSIRSLQALRPVRLAASKSGDEEFCARFDAIDRTMITA